MLQLSPLCRITDKLLVCRQGKPRSRFLHVCRTGLNTTGLRRQKSLPPASDTPDTPDPADNMSKKKRGKGARYRPAPQETSQPAKPASGFSVQDTHSLPKRPSNPPNNSNAPARGVEHGLGSGSSFPATTSPAPYHAPTPHAAPQIPYNAQPNFPQWPNQWSGYYNAWAAYLQQSAYAAYGYPAQQQPFGMFAPMGPPGGVNAYPQPFPSHPIAPTALYNPGLQQAPRLDGATKPNDNPQRVEATQLPRTAKPPAAGKKARKKGRAATSTETPKTETPKQDNGASVANQQSSRNKGKDPKIMLPAPNPTPEYLAQAAEEPSAVHPPERKLVILDLNGTLLHRPNSRKQPTKMIPRPFLDDFLHYLFGNFAVMVWSSARPENVNILVNLGLKEFGPRLVGRWARDTLGLSAKHYSLNVQCYKDLTRVWSSDQIQRHMPGYADGKRFDQRNSILIDDSTLKASAQPHNLVEIPEFNGSMDHMQQDVLGEVAGYLELVKMQDDVSKFIRKSPFKADKTWGYQWPQKAEGSVVDALLEALN